MIKRQSIILTCLIGVTISTLLGIDAIRRAEEKARVYEAAYRPIEVLFEIHRDQGWSVVSAPTDGRRYRICGATQMVPTSGIDTFGGSFSTSGKTVSFEVNLPTDQAVAVEGLEPRDGGPLSYVVLTRKWSG